MLIREIATCKMISTRDLLAVHKCGEVALFDVITSKRAVIHNFNMALSNPQIYTSMGSAIVVISQKMHTFQYHQGSLSYVNETAINGNIVDVTPSGIVVCISDEYMII